MASAQQTTKKRLALAVIDFLNKSATDGTIDSEDAESIEIATNCIAESFKVDPTDAAAMADAVGGQSLLQIYGVYEKMKNMKAAAGVSSGAGPSTGAAAPGPAPPSADAKEKADKLKTKGNEALKERDFTTAIDYYTQALELVPLNAIYLSNRSAAYSHAQKYTEAHKDAEMAVAADPKYAKAWSRLGVARMAMADYKGAVEAYKQGLDAEGGDGSDNMRKGYESAKKKLEEEAGPEIADEVARGASEGPGAGGMPDFSGLANILGGGGGGGGGGGMPDLSSMMSNPTVQRMMQTMSQNPQLMQGLLNNPRLRDMMSGGGAGGGGMPDLGSLMQDPSIMEMARNLMGGMGGPGGAGGPGAGGPPPS